MSDPVTKAQIEDVLSSIRRLVSEDARQPMRNRGPEAGHQERAEPENAIPDKLVLTPSLRVAEPEAADNTDDHDAYEAEAGFSVADQGEVADFIEITPELEEDQPRGEIIDIAPDIEESTGFAAEAEIADGADPMYDDNTLSEDDLDLEFEEEIEPDLDSDRGADGSEGEAGDAAPWTDPEATLFEAAGVSALSESLSEQENEAHRIDETLTRKVARLEKMISSQDEEWEPDGIQIDDDYSGTEVEAMSWEDATPDTDDGAVEETRTPLRALPTGHEDEDHAPEQAPEAAAAADDDASDALGLQDAVMDEAALRELVADIVREELQGALGERITRNVRKLVRREIHRALSIQDLD